LGIEERAHRFARTLIGFRRGVGEKVQTAVHVGVFFRVGLLNTVEHGLRLLRRSSIVEVDKRLAVNLTRESGEVRAYARDVVGTVGHGGVHQALAFSQAATWPSNASRRPACSIPSIASPTKAWISKASASFAGIPRAMR